jgi:hypothetical protein
LGADMCKPGGRGLLSCWRGDLGPAWRVLSFDGFGRHEILPNE